MEGIQLSTRGTPISLVGCSSSKVRQLQMENRNGGRAMVVKMRDRSKNRKPLQRGRNLSIEAIQVVQALKRATSLSPSPPFLEQVFDSKFRRLLKFDMLAVLREFIRQNECLLALKVFDDIRKENWYKPQVSLYADMIAVLATNGLFEQLEAVFFDLKEEKGLDSHIGAFNSLLKTLISFKHTELLMDCYELMKVVGCEPDRSSFRTIINGLDLLGETDIAYVVRHDARRIYGQSLEFLNEEEEIIASRYSI